MIVPKETDDYYTDESRECSLSSAFFVLIVVFSFAMGLLFGKEVGFPYAFCFFAVVTSIVLVLLTLFTGGLSPQETLIDDSIEFE